MEKYREITLFVFVLLFASCKPSQVSYVEENTNKWYNIAVAEDVEIFVDTTSIRREGSFVYAQEKRVYTSTESKKLYVDKIKDVYIQLKKPEKITKWNDFSYCIYSCEYDCPNKRFRILSVEDYDSNNKRIVKTTHNKKNIRWLDVETETVGDYTFFTVCDYE